MGMGIELITILMFGSLLLVLAFGLPVAFACGSVGIIFTAILQGPAALNLVSTRITGLMVQYLLAAIPLFILMANILERSGIISDIYEMVYQWMGGIKGGVATATVMACTMMAAMCGVIGASEVTMGVIALPQMLNRKYDKYIACGSILAGGTLGILIPPSVMLIVYGLVDNSSIGRLYAGAFMPGFMLAIFYIAYITIRCYINPVLGPPVPPDERMPINVRMRLLVRLVPAAILIFLVLGTIFTGIAAPTEAAGVGAVGAFLITVFQGKMTGRKMFEATETTIKATAMVLWTMFGANIFVSLYVMVGGAKFVHDSLAGSGLGPYGILIIINFILILLGFFLDWVGIIMLCVPIFGPLIRHLGFDPVWFGVLFATNLQISFLSPPFGYALFYLKAVAPPEVSTLDIWKSAVVFMFIQAFGVFLCIVFPQIITWLPDILYKGA